MIEIILKMKINLSSLLILNILKLSSSSSSSSLNSNNLITNYLTSCDNNGQVLTLLKESIITSSSSSSSTSFSTSSSITSNEIDLSISINLSQKFQNILGYGAGLPQSSAYVLSKLKVYSLETYEYVMNNLFSNSNGSGLSILRFPMGSCDFSLTNTSYDEFKDDYNLSYFEIDDDSKIIISVLQDALKINPDITLIASPWSAPSWLKEWNSLLGLSPENTLLSTDEAYNTYANYFKLTYEKFLSYGLKISYFTLQNEPLFGDNKQYPGMYFTAENEYRLGLLVSKLLGDKVKLLAYDHNWDHPEYPLEILSKQSTDELNIFDGTAWHCYGGDMSTALSLIKKSYPLTSQHVTECTASFPSSTCDITKGMSSFGWDHEWDMKNLFLGATQYGSSSGTKWIMALDENCGPVLPDVEYTFGRPFVSIPLNLESNITVDDIKWNQDYWTTSHMSRFIKPNDVRVETLVTGDSINDIITETFYNSNTHQVTCYVMNLNHEKEYLLQVQQDNHEFQYRIPFWSTAIFQWYE